MTRTGGARVKKARDPEKRFCAGMRSALRRCWLWFSPERKACLAASIRDGRAFCATCGEGFPRSTVKVDHVTPCGQFLTTADAPGFVERLLVPASALQTLCNGCHKAKTAKERAARCKAKAV